MWRSILRCCRFAVVVATAILLGAIVDEPVIASDNSLSPIGIVVKGNVVRAPTTQLHGDRVLAAVEHDHEAVAPVNEILRIFDASARVERATGAIQITGGGHTLLLRIDERQATIDGREVQLSIPPELHNGTILLPVRAIAEAFGADVAWMPDQRLVVLEPNPGHPPAATPSPVKSPTPSASPSVNCCCCNTKTPNEPHLSGPWELPAALIAAEALFCGVLIWWRFRRGLTWLLLTQLLIGLLGIVGATLRAFPVDRTADTPYPVVDTTTGVWIFLTVIAFFLPRITKLKIFNTELELKDDIKATTKLLERSTLNLALLLQNWTEALAIFEAQYTSGVADRTLLLMNFIRDRLGETKLWLDPDGTDNAESNEVQPQPNQGVRLVVWIYDAGINRLRFFYSNEITDQATLDATFAPGQGLVGQAFLEARFWNKADAESVPGFVRIAGERHVGGVICAPIWLRERGSPLGMITVDKPGVGYFAPVEANIIKSLAALISIAWRTSGLDTTVPATSKGP